MPSTRLPCLKLTLRVTKGQGMAARIRTSYTRSPTLRGYGGEFDCLIMMWVQVSLKNSNY